MSIHLVVEVWKSDLDRNCKSIALIYADAASDDGNGIYFSLEHAAWKSGYDERSVRRISQILEEIGVLQFLGRSESKTKRYRFIENKLPQRPSWKEYREQRKNIVDKMSATSRTKCPVEADKMSDNPTSDPTYSNLLTSDSFFQKEGELENPSSTTPQDSVSPIPSNSEFGVVNRDQYRTLHNVYSVVIPPTPPTESIAQVFAAELPVEPVTAKSKPKNAAAPKPPKPPKEPREMSERDLAFLAKIARLNPLIAPDVEKRLGMYRRSNPWSVTQIFLLTGIWPNKSNWNAITSLNGEAFDTEKLVSCFSAWTAKGWSPKNLDWVFNWYKAGGPPQYVKYGQQPQQQQPAPAPSKPELAFEDERVVAFANWIYDQPVYKGKGLYAIQLAARAALNGKSTQQMGNVEELLVKYQAEQKGQDHAS